MRPNCKRCDTGLPPEATDARICSYEGTYCADGVEKVLHNVCPTCGGGFSPRPIRQKNAYREGLALGLEHHSASTTRKHSKWRYDQVKELSDWLKDVRAEER